MLLEVGGGLLTDPGLSVTRREHSQHKQSLGNTCNGHIYAHSLSALQEAFRPSPTGPHRETWAPAKTPRTWTDTQGQSNPQGQRTPFAPPETHTNILRERERERGSRLGNEHTPLLSALLLNAPNSHMRWHVYSYRQPPDTLNSVPLGWFCLPPIRSGETRQARESSVPGRGSQPHPLYCTG